MWTNVAKHSLLDVSMILAIPPVMYHKCFESACWSFYCFYCQFFYSFITDVLLNKHMDKLVVLNWNFFAFFYLFPTWYKVASILEIIAFGNPKLAFISFCNLFLWKVPLISSFLRSPITFFNDKHFFRPI